MFIIMFIVVKFILFMWIFYVKKVLLWYVMSGIRNIDNYFYVYNVLKNLIDKQILIIKQNIILVDRKCIYFCYSQY